MAHELGAVWPQMGAHGSLPRRMGAWLSALHASAESVALASPRIPAPARGPAQSLPAGQREPRAGAASVPTLNPGSPRRGGLSSLDLTSRPEFLPTVGWASRPEFLPTVGWASCTRPPLPASVAPTPRSVPVPVSQPVFQSVLQPVLQSVLQAVLQAVLRAVLQSVLRAVLQAVLQLGAGAASRPVCGLASGPVSQRTGVRPSPLPALPAASASMPALSWSLPRVRPPVLPQPALPQPALPQPVLPQAALASVRMPVAGASTLALLASRRVRASVQTSDAESSMTAPWSQGQVSAPTRVPCARSNMPPFASPAARGPLRAASGCAQGLPYPRVPTGGPASVAKQRQRSCAAA